MKKGQISIIEIPIILLLFSSIIGYLYFSPSSVVDVTPSLRISSFLNAIYYDESFRDEIMQENLSNSSVTGNWSALEAYLSMVFANYELTVANKTVEKKIFSCSPKYNKEYVERIISIENNTHYEFRKIRLGVCY